jgi:hypothetical protein
MGFICRSRLAGEPGDAVCQVSRLRWQASAYEVVNGLYL